jgi:cell wall-associated NlpC family hydrolase
MNKEGAIERMRELAAAKIPFLHQGRDHNGIDCVGGLAYAFQYDGEMPAYPQDPVNGELERELCRVFGPPLHVRASTLAEPLAPALFEPGDVVSMQYKGPVRHVALVAAHVDQRNCPGALSIIHTDSSLGRVTEHIFDFKWQRRVMKVWRP